MAAPLVEFSQAMSWGIPVLYSIEEVRGMVAA